MPTTITKERADKSERMIWLERTLRGPVGRGLRLVLLILLMALTWYAYRTLFPPLPEADVVSLGPSKTELQIVDKSGGAYLLLPDGKLWIWGLPGGLFWAPNNCPELPSPHPKRVIKHADWLKISATAGHEAGIKPDGSVWEWGSSSVVSLRGDIGGLDGARQVSNQSIWRSVAPGDNMITGVREDGTLWCWNYWSHGPKQSPSPSTFSPPGDGATGGSPLPGTNFTMSQGQAHDAAWMRRYGGRGAPPSRGTNATPRIGPGQIGTNSDWLQVVSYKSLYLGLRKNGTIWAWGSLSGLSRIIGGGVPDYFPAPVQICAETNWIELTAAIVPLARNRQGELWQPLTQSPDPVAAGWVVGQLLATNVLAKGYSLVQGDRTNLFAIRADGSLWRTSRALRPFGRGAHAQPSSNWERVGKRQDWVWLSSGRTTGFGLTADHTLWVFGRDFGRAGNPDIVTRWRVFHERLREAIRPGMGGIYIPSRDIPIQWEPRPLIHMRGTNWQPLPPLPAISTRQGSEGGKAE